MRESSTGPTIAPHRPAHASPGADRSAHTSTSVSFVSAAQRTASTMLLKTLRGEANHFLKGADEAFDLRDAASETLVLRHIRELSVIQVVDHHVRAVGQAFAHAVEQPVLVGGGDGCSRDMRVDSRVLSST